VTIKQVRVYSPSSLVNLFTSFYVSRIAIGNFWDIQTALVLLFEEQALAVYGTIVSEEASNLGKSDY
jgi:hypothetical protein